MTGHERRIYTIVYTSAHRTRAWRYVSLEMKPEIYLKIAAKNERMWPNTPLRGLAAAGWCSGL